jgi:hypothetical protein
VGSGGGCERVDVGVWSYNMSLEDGGRLEEEGSTCYESCMGFKFPKVLILSVIRLQSFCC